MTPGQRFVSKFKLSDKNSCWLWIGAAGRGSLGYGSFYWDGKRISAHRASWIIFNSPIPDQMCVLHKCDVPLCVNPHHLFLGTQQDNVHDCMRKGRAKLPDTRGVLHRGAKLTEADVLAIRASTEKGKLLAKKYDVVQSVISRIRHRQIWKHI